MNNKKISVLGNFTKYVSLNVLGMIGLSCYILADTFFVANGLGANGLTALNLAIPIYSFVNGLGLMVGMGGATKYSMIKTDTKQGSEVFSKSVLIALIISLILIFIGIFNADLLTSILGANSDVFEYTKIYIMVILIFSPAFLLNNILICFVRNDGNPRLSMCAMLVGSFLNIVLDYVFIFPLNMGMLGAVLATGLAPIFSIIVLSLHFIKRQNKFYFTKVKLSLKSVFNIFSLGVSFLITEFSAGIVMIIFNIIILNISGNIGVAAYGIVANLSLVATSIFTGISMGIQPIISHAFGQGDYKVIKKIYRYAFISVVIISAVIYTAIIIFEAPIIQLFNKEQSIEIFKIASIGLRLYFIAFIFMGINIITAVKFNSIGDTKKSFIISIMRGFIFIISCVFLMSNLFGMIGVWLSFPVSELLTVLVCLIFLYGNKNAKLH